ncbi:MAG: ABC-F family ATP-binding cassette domain-containing protein [Cryomorphaceae bacterium]|nr:ABC-F family ATP-binding cassette domain-containing protein [Cryomorphaceae bacterium]
MNLLSIENLAKGFADKMLFSGLHLGLHSGEKVALVGANGAGKSTLMKVLMQEILPDEGRVAIRKGIRVEYLRQHPTWTPGMTVRAVMLDADHPTITLFHQYHKAVAENNASQMAEYSDLMEKHNGWQLEENLSELLRRFELENALYKPWNELSGGQQRRLGLARLLFAKPDVMLLDEPTNHLDLDMVEWLEKFLSDPNFSLIMVTHDRYFLDAIADTIWELESQQIFRHEGNYASYLENKVLRDEINQATLQKNKNLYRKELDWMRRQPKARTTKSRARIDAFGNLESKVKQQNHQKSMQLRTEKVAEGGKILELVNVSVARGEKRLLNNLEYVFKKGDRIGLVGKNGMGKTSLLEVLTGRLDPATGKVIHGLNTNIGYFRQDDNILNPDLRVIDQVKEIAEYVTLADGSEISVSKFLEEFLFSYAKQQDFIEGLSGGEKKRLQLLLVLIQHPNFLILDEPTNDLDRDTLLVLEEYLENFQGSMILVSHDRFFLDQLVDQLWVMEGEGKMRMFPGNYTEYREFKRKQKEAIPKIKTTSTPKKSKTTGGLTYGERIEYDKLMESMDKLEAEVKRLSDQVAEKANDFDALQPLLEELQKAQNTLDTAMERWLELEEKLD